MFTKKPTQSAPSLRRTKQSGRICGMGGELGVLVLVGSLMLMAAGGFWYEFSTWQQQQQQQQQKTPNGDSSLRRAQEQKQKQAVVMSSDSHPTNGAAHLTPIVPVLPIFSPIDNAEYYMQETLQGRPTMAGVVAILQTFLSELHIANRNFHNMKLAGHPPPETAITDQFFELATTHLLPFDKAYRDKPIFPIRQDDSVFLSLAAFREHLLKDTLVNAFSEATHPERLFVGAVVQNCFGKVLEDGSVDTSGFPCRTGLEVVGKNDKGRDMTKVSDAPPDKNGIQEFCDLPEYSKYCTNGQVRALYVHETESQGPAMARYYASKLWGGETYFVQVDSHLQFANHWDVKYIAEIQATRNYPKSILSSYPPGFGQGVHESNGARLCSCDTKQEDPNPIIRINVGVGYHGTEPRPTQIPFIAAGFFFTHSSFLTEIPFDPLIPWCFMGEEIALSMRSWTHGWNIYAPRKNLIAHQYRPGRMGLPKFWETANRLYKPGMIYQIQHKVLKRIKHMVGYPDSSLEKIKADHIEFVLQDLEYYGLGTVRTWEEYMEFTNMSIDKENDVIVCSRIDWCNKGLKD